MQKIFHSTMDCFIGATELPVWVVYLGKGRHPARFFHDHNYSEIAVIIRGPARHVLDGENVPVAAGDVLIIGPKGVVEARGSAIVAKAHVHMTPSDARAYNVPANKRN